MTMNNNSSIPVTIISTLALLSGVVLCGIGQELLGLVILMAAVALAVGYSQRARMAAAFAGVGKAFGIAVTVALLAWLLLFDAVVIDPMGDAVVVGLLCGACLKWRRSIVDRRARAAANR
tara:strand:+ start:419 stop:778 length:360 start_codon:yes stop_codon:yes gene_type:complete